MHQRGRDRQPRQHRAHRAVGHHPSGIEVGQTVGVAHDPLQPVLGQHNGQAQVIVEAHQGAQHVFSRLGIELAGRLIQHQNARPQRQSRGDSQPLPLAARQGMQPPVAQRRQVEQIEHLFDASAHLVRRHGGVLQGKGDLPLDTVEHGLRLRILSYEANVAAEDTRPGLHGVKAGHAHLPGQHATAEVGHEAVEAAQQRRLARARRPGNQNELPFGHVPRHPAQGRAGALGIGVGQAADGDHGHTSSTAGAASPRSSMPATRLNGGGARRG